MDVEIRKEKFGDYITNPKDVCGEAILNLGSFNLNKLNMYIITKKNITKSRTPDVELHSSSHFSEGYYSRYSHSVLTFSRSSIELKHRRD